MNLVAVGPSIENALEVFVGDRVGPYHDGNVLEIDCEAPGQHVLNRPVPDWPAWATMLHSYRAIGL